MDSLAFHPVLSHSDSGQSFPAALFPLKHSIPLWEYAVDIQTLDAVEMGFAPGFSKPLLVGAAGTAGGFGHRITKEAVSGHPQAETSLYEIIQGVKQKPFLFHPSFHYAPPKGKMGRFFDDFFVINSSCIFRPAVLT